MIFTEVGEIGIEHKGAVLKLRPSLYAISKLGSPSEIVAIFAEIMDETDVPHLQAAQQVQALGVIAACADDSDADRVAQIFGTVEIADKPQGTSIGVYRFVSATLKPGLANPAVLLPIARSLMRHGVVGAVPPQENPDPDPDSEPEYMTEFRARDFAASVIAHLGMNERDAWAMTMTGITLAMRSKYPMPEKQTPGKNAPSSAEHDAAMEWADKIEAMRVTQGV